MPTLRKQAFALWCCVLLSVLPVAGFSAVPAQTTVFTVNSKTPYDCATATNGSITIDFVGQAPYDISLDNTTLYSQYTPSGPLTIPNLGPGWYNLSITDAGSNNQELNFLIGTDIEWTDLVGVNNSPPVLHKTAADGWGNGGAATDNRIPANADGFMEFQYTGSNGEKGFGLQKTNPDAKLGTVEYAWYIRYNEAIVEESGFTKAGPFQLAGGEYLSVERVGSTVYYKIDGVVQYSTSVNPAQGLIGDASIYTQDVTFEGWFSHCPVDPCAAVVHPGTAIEICETGSQQMMVTGGTDWIWQPNDGLSCTSCPDPVISAATALSSYTVDIYDAQYSTTQPCTTITVNVTILDQSLCTGPELLGCCFSNYGAEVYVTTGANLDVYCNLLNETGGIVGGAPQEGRFTNEGDIRVEEDWIHNANNQLFSSYAGHTELIGTYQRIRGTQSTHFNDLTLSGAGTKEIFIDTYTHSDLDLTHNELAAPNHVLYVLNSAPTAIDRTSGFVSTDNPTGNGYLSRVCDNSGEFLFPLGSTLGTTRYRPIALDQLNPGDVVAVRFINLDPASQGFSTKAPNVAVVNDQFFHKIQSSTTADLQLKAWYADPVDGDFQSIVHFNDVPAEWKITPDNVLITVPADMDYVRSSGVQDWTDEPFALARAGFYINTDNFGGGTGGGNYGDNSAGGLGGGTGSSGGSGGVGYTVTLDGGGTGGSGSGLGGPNGTGGTGTFTPTPVPGDYVMHITSGSCSIDGSIHFTIETDGSITNVVFEDDFGNSGPLSEDLYEIDLANSGLILNDTPDELIPDASNALRIRFGTDNDILLDNGQDFLIDGITPGIDLASIEFFRNGSSVGSYSSFANSGSAETIDWATMNGFLGLGNGPYSFELTITDGGSNEIIYGQFIATPTP